MLNKLTQEDIDKVVLTKSVLKLGDKTTCVVLQLVNGFEVIGTSACVDPKDYNEELGESYAMKRAMDKVWELEGYVLQNDIFKNKNGDKNE